MASMLLKDCSLPFARQVNRVGFEPLPSHLSLVRAILHHNYLIGTNSFCLVEHSGHD